MSHVLIARMDSLGDVLLSGPLVRAVAATAEEITYLAGPAGSEAARLLPGVDQVVVGRAGWIEAKPPPVDRAAIDRLVDQVAQRSVEQALILTSFHQSALPLALVLRMAGVPYIGAVSIDYPGSLLDVRHEVDDDIHEVERALSLGRAMGYRLPGGDDGALHVTVEPGGDHPLLASQGLHAGDYVVVHPGTSVPARAWRPSGYADVVERLSLAGWPVVVTGGTTERRLTACVAGPQAVDLGGQLDLPELACVLGGARALVVANTGPAHLAAAMGTPVVSVFAATVPSARWRPWMVPHTLLGDQAVACAGCRARVCPVPGHPCVDRLEPTLVADAAERLARTQGQIVARLRLSPTSACVGGQP